MKEEWEGAAGRGRMGGGNREGEKGRRATGRGRWRGEQCGGAHGAGGNGEEVKEMGLAHGMPGWNEITVFSELAYPCNASYPS